MFDLPSTITGTPLATAYNSHWDMQHIQDIVGKNWQDALERQDFWDDGFAPVPTEWFDEAHFRMGYEMAKVIRDAKLQHREIGMIFPIGPVGQYRWCVYFLRKWQIRCDHFYGFSMDDWSDNEGNTQNVFTQEIKDLFYTPLGEYTVPEDHRFFATKEDLPKYADAIKGIKDRGGSIVLVYSIGWPGHFSMNDPHWAEDNSSMDDYMQEQYRVACTMDWISFEENSTTAFLSNWTAVSGKANSLSTGLMMQADYTIGGILAQMPGTSHEWQGIHLWTTLRYRPDMWMPCSIIPTKPGKLFFVKELAEVSGPFELTEN